MKRLGMLLLTLGLTACPTLPVPGSDAPSVLSVNPNPDASNVPVGARVEAALNLPNGGLSVTTVDEQSVRLVNMATGEVVNADVDVNNDAETLTIEPNINLDFEAQYEFTITSAVEDASGAAFQQYTSTFTTVSGDAPSVTRSSPENSERGVFINLPQGIAASVNLVGSGIDGNTVTTDNVYLVNMKTQQRVPGSVGTSGGRDSITFQPSRELDRLTEYQFNVTSGVTDQNGVAFLPYTSTFTTGTERSLVIGNVERVTQSVTTKVRHSSLAFDKSGDYLYATTIIGEIKRYPVGSDGSLGAPETITSLLEAEGGPRLTIGLAFDPASTPSNPIVWVTHTYIDLSSFDGSVEAGIGQYWSGKLTRLSGPNLENVQDYVVNLPRSNKDHVTNSVAFNPDEPGVVYFVQGSNTAMGAPDRAWGPQGERVLTGAVLRLDTDLLGNNLPLDAKTEEGGTYDPYAPNAPLTVYASGTRNSYDLVWHSNGNLYVPANGSAAGGFIPRYDPIPGTCENRPDEGYNGTVIADPAALPGYSDVFDGWTVGQRMNDYLFKIEEGGYYGTPNPKRCEWILFGGSVGTGDGDDVINLYREYASPVLPDPRYKGYIYNFGTSISPNGSIEYTGDAFSDLKGKLLVTRYANGDDVVALGFDGSGNVISDATFAPPVEGGLKDPIDITEDPNTGYLYVSYYDQLSGEAATKAGIALLRPQ